MTSQMEEKFLRNFRTEIFKRGIGKMAYLSILVGFGLISGCSKIKETPFLGEVITKVTKTVAETDSNLRIRKVRKALKKGEIAEAENQRNAINLKHWLCVANIEIATAKYPKEKEEALRVVNEATEAIWTIEDGEGRTEALLSLIDFKLGSEGNVEEAKQIIKQAEQTIELIPKREDVTRESLSNRLAHMKTRFSYLLAR